VTDRTRPKAERVCVTDPWNLSWVMPAEGGGIVSSSPQAERQTRHRRSQVIVLTGGDEVLAGHTPPLPDEAVVIAADSGLAAAATLHLDVDRVVGDMDSVDATALGAAQEAGAVIERHPADKDRTDLAIALDAALEHAPQRIVVVGGHGGRLDHLLANALLLASPEYGDVEVVAHMGGATVTVVRASAAAADLSGVPGELVSLLPAHGPARGVTTTGLRFALDREDLLPGSSRGVSNVFTATHATVHVDGGLLLAVQPHASARTPNA